MDFDSFPSPFHRCKAVCQRDPEGFFVLCDGNALDCCVGARGKKSAQAMGAGKWGMPWESVEEQIFELSRRKKNDQIGIYYLCCRFMP